EAVMAHQIPKVAHTLVEIAEVARYAYEHRSGHAPDHDGATALAADGEEAARLRAENAVLRARLADDLALLRELQGAPFVSQECPPDVSPSHHRFDVLEDCFYLFSPRCCMINCYRHLFI
uniref:Uncharacterized protein n=1 Tax=Aegilops tauschii subsp. strangulata TaxID=200361 RepID=A0A453H5K0_AEGTS